MDGHHSGVTAPPQKRRDPCYLFAPIHPPPRKHKGNVALSNTLAPLCFSVSHRWFASAPPSFFFLFRLRVKWTTRAVTPACAWKAGNHVKMTRGWTWILMYLWGEMHHRVQIVSGVAMPFICCFFFPLGGCGGRGPYVNLPAHQRRWSPYSNETHLSRLHALSKYSKIESFGRLENCAQFVAFWQNRRRLTAALWIWLIAILTLYRSKDNGKTTKNQTMTTTHNNLISSYFVLYRHIEKIGLCVLYVMRLWCQWKADCCYEGRLRKWRRKKKKNFAATWVESRLDSHSQRVGRY